MTNTNWRSLVATAAMAFGCCSLASANVTGPSLATPTLSQRPLSGPVSAPDTARKQELALSCYGTLEGFLKCVENKKIEGETQTPPVKKT